MHYNIDLSDHNVLKFKVIPPKWDSNLYQSSTMILVNINVISFSSMFEDIVSQKKNITMECSELLNFISSHLWSSKYHLGRTNITKKPLFWFPLTIQIGNKKYHRGISQHMFTLNNLVILTLDSCFQGDKIIFPDSIFLKRYPVICSGSPIVGSLSEATGIYYNRSPSRVSVQAKLVINIQIS